VQALRGVSLEVAPGEIYGLLGRNGAGKTTLVKILLDLVRPSRGATWLSERSSREPRARRSVGYLPEDHRFPDYQTAAGAIRFYAALSGADGDAVRRRIPELLAEVDLEHAAGKKIRTFSKGMKQRLGLAQALVHDPEVLFLDEPTDGVDPVGRAEIRKLLEAQRERGRTIFLNSHLLSEVEQICDRVGILDRGRLVREGSIDELTHTGHAFELRTEPAIDAEAAAALGAITTSVRIDPAGAVEIGVVDAAGIDAVVDLLRARGIGVRHLVGKRMSLEEVFLAAVVENGTEDRP
jgi:ABC-2 type transport system ATP-binding protein